MNLRNLSDPALLEKTDQLVRQERELLTCVLHHLREIERRRLFSQLGFSSLFEYATRKLGYADDQAMRRISAMRLLRDLPELEGKIASGSLSLSNLSMARTLFRQEEKRGFAGGTPGGFSREEKLDLLASLENRSKREAERIIVSRSSSPQALRPDRVRAISESAIEIKFIADSGLQAKLDKVRGLLAHSHPQMTLAEAVDWLCELAIRKLDPAVKSGRERGRREETTLGRECAPSRVAAPSAAQPIAGSSPAEPAPRIAPALPEAPTPPPAPAPALKLCIKKSAAQIHPKPRTHPKKRPPIPAGIRRTIWQRARSRCEHCGSAYGLQMDHRKPVATGGSSEIKNLRLLCRSCNQRAAIREFGLAKIERYLEPAQPG